VNKKINVVTLGCSKNIVDSEYLMKQLDAGGWEVLHDSDDPSAKVVVINTCGFIADAKEESVETILNFIEAKKKGLIEHVFVMGCLSQRYKDDLEKEIPEVDGFFGVNQMPEILASLKTNESPQFFNRRLITTPNHFAYLKISEGCSWGCSFCAIPLIRGKHKSLPIQQLVDQAISLSEKGVKELILIAQDSTFYGKDLYGKRMLPELVRQISLIEGIEWIRIHYAYPANFPTELLIEMAQNPKVCNYIDIPFQHISDRVLQSMKRGINKHETLQLVNDIRSYVPNITIRTTLLVGHPNETEQDFDELVDFVAASRFERLGVFAYSPEEGTLSYSLKDSVSQEEKERRVSILMDIQRKISSENNRKRIGQQLKVIIDRVEGDYYVARSEFDSPEVDAEVLLLKENDTDIPNGSFVNCVITESEDYDLFGKII
jgi:ribosomal protein S12 methylthiotransferase